MSSLKEIRQAENEAYRGKGDKQDRESASHWLQQIIQMIPAPVGWKAILSYENEAGRKEYYHLPLIGIGLTRSGATLPVPINFDGCYEEQAEFCVEGKQHGPHEWDKPCPACEQEREPAAF